MNQKTSKPGGDSVHMTETDVDLINEIMYAVDSKSALVTLTFNKNSTSIDLYAHGKSLSSFIERRDMDVNDLKTEIIRAVRMMIYSIQDA